MALLDYKLNELTEAVLNRLHDKYRLPINLLTFEEKQIVRKNNRQILDLLNEHDTNEDLLIRVFKPLGKTSSLKDQGMRHLELMELFKRNNITLPLHEISPNQFLTWAVRVRSEIPEKEKELYSLMDIVEALQDMLSDFLMNVA